MMSPLQEHHQYHQYCPTLLMQMAQGQMEWGNRYNSISFQSTDGPVEMAKQPEFWKKVCKGDQFQ
jgi:hypothetical protein